MSEKGNQKGEGGKEGGTVTVVLWQCQSGNFFMGMGIGKDWEWVVGWFEFARLFLGRDQGLTQVRPRRSTTDLGGGLLEGVECIAPLEIEMNE